MTIQLTRATVIAGSVAAAGTQHTLDTATEAHLIYQGIATRVGAAPIFSGPRPAYINAAGTALVLDGVELQYPQQLARRYEPSEARLVKNTGGALSIPTYVAANDYVVHPSVIHVTGGWNGFEYWMAITPYTDGDSQYENPSILCSKDGMTWEVPQGVTNPLVQYPGGSNYNSDPYLFMLPTGEMCIYWRAIVDTNMVHKYITSVNGVDWTSETVALITVRAVEDLTSPSIVWEPHSNKYRMYAHAAGQANYPIVTATADNLFGPWSTRVHCSYGLPAGYTSVWHSEFRPVGGGRCIGLIQSGNNSGGKIYAADASESTIHIGNVVMTRNGTPNVYKSSIFPRPDNTAECWFGFLSAPSMGVEYGEVAFDNTFFRKNNGALLATMTGAALPTLGGGITWDNFNRADGAIGTPTSGVTWTVHSGGVNISGNAATGAGVANNKVYVNSSASDILLRVNCTVFASSGAWVTFRATNMDTDFWRAQLYSGGIQLQSIVGGGVAATYNKVYTTNPGDELTIIALGNGIQILVNNVLVIEVNSAVCNTGTKHGIQFSNATDKLDNFLLIAM